MLDQFYSYLSSKIVEFFSTNPLTSGAKYNIQFEKQEQVRALYEELKNTTLYKEYNYKDDKGEIKYKSYLLNFQGVKLIVSATINNVQPDFLTRLRNMVGVEPGYEDKAILFIHDTNLDSIMGGTESFSKEGMPFHISSIQKDIKEKVSISEFSDVDKAIIDLDLERKSKDLFGENISIFEYRDLLEIIDGTCIEKEQYKNFGLFYDSELKNLTGKELKKRMDTNAIYYNRVDEIHNYGNPEVQLEKYFDEKGVDKLEKENWKDTDYKDVNKFIEEKKKVKPLEYKESNQEWDKEEGSSKAKSRIRNIIVFNENGSDSVDLEITFDDYLKNEFLDRKALKGLVDVSTSGRKIKATIYKSEVDTDFYKIVYKNDKNVKFEFKIVMLECSPKYLESIKTKYSIVMKGKSNYISVNTNDSNIVFNEYAKNLNRCSIEYNNETIDVNEDDKLIVKVSEDFEYENDSDLARFNLKINQCIIPLGIMGTSEKVAPIEGLKVWKLKREKKCDFRLVGDNKLQHGTKEYFTRDDFRRNLQLEKQIIESEGIYFIESTDGLESMNLELNPQLKADYNEIIRYFSISNKLPSLTYLNDELENLYKKFIKIYIRALEEIEEGSYLTKEQKNLFKIGVIKREIEDRELMLTPLHPLNISYQLHINKETSDESMDDEIIKKFTSTYLLPYILDDNSSLYIPMEQHHSPEWKYYVDETLPRYKSSRDFVSKLVHEKIEEFIGHFKYMFNMGNNAPIRINLINTGDSKEILQGIFKYYIKQLKANKTRGVLPIDLFIYSRNTITNAFEEVAFNDDINDLKETYGLDLNVDNMSEEDVLNLYRDRVHFYSKKVEDGIEYAHITFIEMTNDVKTITSKMEDIPSGVILNGVISGVPSVFLGDSYRTGFGTKYANTDNDLMKLAMNLNALNAASGGEPYNNKQCKAISITNKSKTTLDGIYEASHWVTFIDPKVDLNFFKNDPDAKDLLIIHYSDQYTTAGGYDAITVTRKSGPYQRIIEEFLTQKGIKNAHDYSPKIINMFNAVNGDWLLRLLSSKSHLPKEKISILSAIKLALAEFKKDDIIWVPISLEEVLRVSGGAGLKQTEGFFSAKNLGFEKNGATSDDILLVGIENIEENIFVHYYPIEVKIGENNSSYIQKGIEQAKSTKKILNETLLPNENGFISSTQRVYRNFLMQLVITSAEKLNLYNVCSEENWKSVINSDLRRKLLNEEYEISNSIQNTLGQAAVISFKKGNLYNDIRLDDGVMVIEMSEEDGINFITKSVGKIRELVDGINIEGTDIKAIKIEELKNDKEEIIKVEENFTKIKTYKSDNVDMLGKIQETKTPLEVISIESELQAKEEKIENNINTHFNSSNEGDTSIEFLQEEEENIRVLLGNSKGKDIYWEFGDKGLGNRHLLISGKSGQGKTYFIQCLLLELSRRGVPSIIFDYTDGFKSSKLEPEFKEAISDNLIQFIVAKDKFPINPFKKNKKELDEDIYIDEDSIDIAERIKSVLGSVYKQLGIQQLNSIYQATISGVDEYGDEMNFRYLREKLEKDNSGPAKSAIGQLNPLIDKNPFDNTKEFDWNNILNDSGKIFIIQLTGFTRDVQLIITELILWDLWYFTVQNGSKDKPFSVILDEAQNLNFGDNSPYTRILTEGRKFGWSGWFATQFLKGQMNTSAINRLQNAAHKIYFAPPDEEISNIANTLSTNTDEKKYLERELMKLQKGECISYGPNRTLDNTLRNLVYKVKILSLTDRGYYE
ncbi:DNA phosphorothioation-dependent restriction protein DptH [Clostridium massiliodielmoense]|uniref:DNA phosphorothioation-dependent restriction protein DptH n=1 Tax=Clostridium massiliodielmoense TaxID=1776385 RepID=UPI00069DFC3D|nr:DNA phosphorothioation-dependent restriction protein DptH [Clostridium massiliodielmoense]